MRQPNMNPIVLLKLPILLTHEWADLIAQAMIREPEGGKGVENFFFRKNGRRPQDHS